MDSPPQAQDWRGYDPEYDGSTDNDETRLDPDVIPETSLTLSQQKEKAADSISSTMTVNDVSSFLCSRGIIVPNLKVCCVLN